MPTPAPDKATIAGVMAFIKSSKPGTRRRILDELLKELPLRQVAKKILDGYERAEKQAAVLKAPTEAAGKPQPKQRADEPEWIDPDTTRDWLKRS